MWTFENVVMVMIIALVTTTVWHFVVSPTFRRDFWKFIDLGLRKEAEQEIPDERTTQLLAEYIQLLYRHGVGSHEERAFAEAHKDEFFERVDAMREAKRSIDQRAVVQ